MRILRLRILNLNSLRGEHTIDFTKEPLAHHQLYAIVGPTGAGKTTILDAITLALYDQTERNKGENDRKDGTGSVLSYGEGECAAELEFENPQGRFRCLWTRKRARKKSDGALQSAKHSIGRVDVETGEIELLAEKKRETLAKVEEIVGLDYERFVRSTMLTQGEFARFLKSDAGNKAAILEKITGTKIYQELSEAAFQRNKIAKELYDDAVKALESDPPLAPEDREQLVQERSEQETTLTTERTNLDRVSTTINQYKELASLEEQLEATAKESAILEEAWLALNPERAALAQSQEVQDLRADLDTTARLDKELLRLDEELSRLSTSNDDRRAVVATANKLATDCRSNLSEFLAKLPARERKFDQAATLEKEIDAVISGLKVMGEQRVVNEKERARITGAIAERKTEVDRLEKALGGRTAEQIELQAKTIEDRLSDYRKEIEQLRTWLDIRKIKDRVAKGVAEKETHEIAITQYKIDLTAKQQILAKAETARASCEDREKFLLVRESLEKHRHDLKDGDSCPLCGALDHPALKDYEPVTDAARGEAAMARAVAQDEATRANEAFVRAREILRNTELIRTKVLTEVEALEKEVTGIKKPAGDNTQAADQLILQIDAERSNSRKAETELKEIQTLLTSLPQLRKAETELVSYRDQISGFDAAGKELDGKIEAAEQISAARKAKVEELLGGCHTSAHCRKLTATKRQELEAASGGAEQQALRRQSELDQVSTQLTEASKRRATFHEDNTLTKVKLGTELAKLNLTETEARIRLLSTAEEAQLRTTITAANDRRTVAGTRFTQLTEDAEKRKRVLAGEPSLTALTEQKTVLEQTVGATQETIGQLKLRLQQDDDRITRTAAGREQLDGLRKERDRWSRLNDLIGSSDGKKFRSYAQAITLQRLIDIGNAHLENISPRYRMEYEPPERGGKEELNMIIIDQFQNDNRRTMATLSGGETFLISLALALGLSDLASGKSLIQSLFIDEGFGTLDGKTLDKAMTTLEGLQAQGKTIGLISHVPQLRERIQCQLVLEPVGDGFSKIELVG
ncbi:AAA family ATPase [Neolewinella antarctica]|uniref:Exonuclease SbcC n=1 Tax=Neolewinella antarctica TaxID=442734 RepID=A0ABX0XBN6_9BACT|nr:AAA family ATPase [Neolewinella antarctica]NJC26391.1 exonuclease SbcC [Neolewinella antarctica]